jgi:hypothetical protein
MTLPDWVKVGAAFSTGEDKWHVRALVDGGALCRRWRAAKRRWHYEFLDDTWFSVWSGRIKTVKTK